MRFFWEQIVEYSDTFLRRRYGTPGLFEYVRKMEAPRCWPKIFLHVAYYSSSCTQPKATMSNDNDDLEGADIWGGGGAGGDDDNGGGSNNKTDEGKSSSEESKEPEQEETKEAEADPAAEAAAAEAAALDAELEDETRHMSTAELRQRIHLLDNDIRIMRSDLQRIAHESRGQRERIKENQEKVKVNKQLPYLVGNVDDAGKKLVSTTYECLWKSIKACKPGMYYRDIGNIITKHASANGFDVVRTYW